MSIFDSKALTLARQVMALTRQAHIGGEAQLLAKIQCLFVEAMEYAAPGSNSPVWVGVDWAEGCKPSDSPVIPDDTRRMDWLVSKAVNVREPMVYGSHSLFWSQTISDDWEEEHKTTLREQIDAAMVAAAPGKEG